MARLRDAPPCALRCASTPRGSANAHATPATKKCRRSPLCGAGGDAGSGAGGGASGGAGGAGGVADSGAGDGAGGAAGGADRGADSAVPELFSLARARQAKAVEKGFCRRLSAR